MIELLKNHMNTIFSIVASLITAGGLTFFVCTKIKQKKHTHDGNNIAKNGSIAADNINAPVHIRNKH